MIIKAAADNMVDNEIMSQYLQVVWDTDSLNTLKATYDDINDIIQTVKNDKIRAETDIKIDMDTGEIK